ncbi:MAG TPA: LLM class F420-dependent oxidoreductase [Acidimicrobiia bacterium]
MTPAPPDLGRVGVWTAELRFATDDTGAVADAGAELEELGYGSVWVPGGLDEPFDTVRTLLGATRRLVAATGIVNVWGCAAPAAAAAHAELTTTHPSRFLLGVGVSHAPLVDHDAPGRYRQPLATMTRYLDALDRAPVPVPKAERVIAALGPRMLALAAERAAGSHPYLVTPEQTLDARRRLGSGALLAPEQGVVLEADPGTARATARAALGGYLGLPNYVNNWRRAGFSDDEFAGGGSDRLVDALVAWGPDDVIAGRIREHHDAGADHVCLQVLGSGGRMPLHEWRRLAAVVM